MPRSPNPTPITSSYSERPLRGYEAFVYGFKRRAKLHHCLGYGTFSVDVSGLDALRKAYCRTVTPITNVAVYVKAVALAMSRHPQANAILFKRWYGYRIVRFGRIDVNVPIHRRLGQDDLTFIGTVRGAAEKSISEIQAELTALQRNPPESLPSLQRILWFEHKPLWLARLIHYWMARSPRFYVRNVGTCGLTLDDNDGEDHFFPIAPTSVVFGLGSVRSEPVVRDGQIAIARILRCSLMIDNYVIPGLLGGSVLKEFKTLLESGRVISEELEKPAS